jgi:hypothetical protein
MITGCATAVLLAANATAQIVQLDPLSKTTGVPREAIDAAKTWLDVIDADKPDLAWDQATAFFQSSITKKDWNERVGELHRAFGHVRARSFVSAEIATQMPNAPSGHYWVLRFSTQGYRRRIDEIVTVEQLNNGWKVAGFFARSSRAFRIRGVGALPMHWN